MLDFLLRESHIWFGILWIGLLYYFNFVQTEYFKEADADARKDVVQKLVPRALWYFRWAAAFTFLTGIVLLFMAAHPTGGGMGRMSGAIIVGALLGTFMAANVWYVIWPNQQIVISGEGDTAAAGAKAALASRTNTFFSFGMLTLMVASAHSTYGGIYGVNLNTAGVWIGVITAFAIEANVLFGKMIPPLASVRDVIISGLVYAVFLYAIFLI